MFRKDKTIPSWSVLPSTRETGQAMAPHEGWSEAPATQAIKILFQQLAIRCSCLLIDLGRSYRIGFRQRLDA
jgi:hypothetical protein